MKHLVDLAIKLSRKNTTDINAHLCALLVRKGRVVSVGFNSRKTHPKSPHPWHTLHAEADAIIGVPEDVLRGATLIVARTGFVGRNRSLLAKPCVYCHSMIERAGIRRVCFTDGTPKVFETMEI